MAKKLWVTNEQVFAADLNSNFAKVSHVVPATLDETLTAGTPVKLLNTGGVVHAKSLLEYAKTFSGSSQVFNATNTTYINSFWDVVNSRIVVAYYNPTGTKHQAIVGNPNFSTQAITWGTPVDLPSGATNASVKQNAIGQDPTTGKIIIAYEGYMAVATVTASTNSISFGTPISTGSAGYNGGSGISFVVDATNNKLVFLYSWYNSTTHYYGVTAQWISVSGTTPSTSNPYTVSQWGDAGYGASFVQSVFNTSDQTIYYTWDEYGGNNNTAKIGAFKYSSGAWSDVIVKSSFTNGGLSSGFMGYDPAGVAGPASTMLYDTLNSKIVIAWEGWQNTVSGVYIVSGAKSGSAWAGGTAIKLDVGGYTSAIDIAQLSTGEFCGCLFKNSTSTFNVFDFSISGTTISVNTFSDTGFGTKTGSIIQIPLNGFAIFYGGIGKLSDPKFANRNLYDGILQDGGSTNDSGKNVVLAGGYVSDLSGLTPTAKYYIQKDGSVTTTQSGWLVGQALSATEMLLEKQFAFEPLNIGIATINITSIGIWVDLDLSSYVPVGTKYVDVAVMYPGNLTFGAAKKNPNPQNRIITNNPCHITIPFIEVDANRKIQVYVSATTNLFITAAYA